MLSDPVRRVLAAACAVAMLLCLAFPAAAQQQPSRQDLQTWYRVVLNLVRHTPTYSPPVASRAFGYLGVVAWEARASGDPQATSLAGQLNGLTLLPARVEGARYDEAMVLNAAMSLAVSDLFANTGPTGQRVMKAARAKLVERAAEALPSDVASRSIAHGEAVAAHVLEWSRTDGGGEVVNMGFPEEYQPKPGPASWVPTSAIRQQQAPLLPAWGTNRPFAMPLGNSCPLPPPPAYSEEPGSDFHKEAMEVYETARNLTPEQKAIARFWSDDPMLSSTPPGHWIEIVLQLAERENMTFDRLAETLAKLGVAQADAFIGCWHSKFEYDLLRPVTYINRVIDPKWRPLLITPPFPEYPSGHSTVSGASAGVLTAVLGEDFAFEDRTHERDGLPARSYPSFKAAAREAAMSRLYGGIHFRAAIDRGIAQGECVAAHANALKFRKQE